MGLDMYLHARVAAPEQDPQSLLALLDPDGFSRGLYPTERYDETTKEWTTDENDQYVTAAYWRKANGVHTWFVRTCQDGVDECQETPITLDTLKALRQFATEDLKRYDAGERNASAYTLYPQSGFFFGGTEIDGWFRQDLVDTIAKMDRLLSIKVPARFSYQSSW